VRKALLVDDEKLIRKGLRAIIERSNSCFGEIYESSGGREALEFISREKIDLVVLDIRMPDMDGIMLLKEAQKVSFKPKFVILSGYDDFHYAADCIKYGAKAYLLKPVKREEFIETLRQVELELSKEEELNSAKQKKDILLSYFRVDELNFIFLKDNLSETEIGEILHTLELDILEREFQIGILAKRGQYHSDPKGYYAQLKMEVYDYFQQINQEAIVFLDIIGNLVFITFKDTDCTGLTASLEEGHGDSFVVGLSNTNHSASQIRLSYLQACEAIKYRMLMPTAKIIPYAAINERSTLYKISLEKIKKIPEIVGTLKAGAINGLLDQLFSDEMVHSYHISYFEKTAGFINEYVIFDLSEYVPRKTYHFEGKYSDLDDMYCFNDIFEYIRYLKEYLEETNRFLVGLKDMYRDKREIEIAMEYIQNNYAKDLCMAMVANHISLNYSYFSYLFKEQTGLSFVDYIKRLRIEKAKELLQKSDDKIYEVAEKVGYHNPKHFGRVFREVTGISPAEYRNRALYTGVVEY
jgi:two-component system response regulator YesN